MSEVLNLRLNFGEVEKKLKVIIVGTSIVGGGFEKVKMLNTFLQSIGHQVEVISLPRIQRK